MRTEAATPRQTEAAAPRAQVRTEQVEQRGEAAVQRGERELSERLHADGAASAAAMLCSGRGLLTAHVPFLSGRDPTVGGGKVPPHGNRTVTARA